MSLYQVKSCLRLIMTFSWTKNGNPFHTLSLHTAPNILPSQTRTRSAPHHNSIHSNVFALNSPSIISSSSSLHQIILSFHTATTTGFTEPFHKPSHTEWLPTNLPFPQSPSSPINAISPKYIPSVVNAGIILSAALLSKPLSHGKKIPCRRS